MNLKPKSNFCSQHVHIVAQNEVEFKTILIFFFLLIIIMNNLGEKTKGIQNQSRLKSSQPGNHFDLKHMHLPHENPMIKQ